MSGNPSDRSKVADKRQDEIVKAIKAGKSFAKTDQEERAQEQIDKEKKAAQAVIDKHYEAILKARKERKLIDAKVQAEQEKIKSDLKAAEQQQLAEIAALLMQTLEEDQKPLPDMKDILNNSDSSGPEKLSIDEGANPELVPNHGGSTWDTALYAVGANPPPQANIAEQEKPSMVIPASVSDSLTIEADNGNLYDVGLLQNGPQSDLESKIASLQLEIDELKKHIANQAGATDTDGYAAPADGIAFNTMRRTLGTKTAELTELNKQRSALQVAVAIEGNYSVAAPVNPEENHYEDRGELRESKEPDENTEAEMPLYSKVKEPPKPNVSVEPSPPTYETASDMRDLDDLRSEEAELIKARQDEYDRDLPKNDPERLSASIERDKKTEYLSKQIEKIQSQIAAKLKDQQLKSDPTYAVAAYASVASTATTVVAATGEVGEENPYLVPLPLNVPDEGSRNERAANPPLGSSYWDQEKYAVISKVPGKAKPTLGGPKNETTTDPVYQEIEDGKSLAHEPTDDKPNPDRKIIDGGESLAHESTDDKPNPDRKIIDGGESLAKESTDDEAIVGASSRTSPQRSLNKPVKKSRGNAPQKEHAYFDPRYHINAVAHQNSKAKSTLGAVGRVAGYVALNLVPASVAIVIGGGAALIAKGVKKATPYVAKGAMAVDRAMNPRNDFEDINKNITSPTGRGFAKAGVILGAVSVMPAYQVGIKLPLNIIKNTAKNLKKLESTFKALGDIENKNEAGSNAHAMQEVLTLLIKMLLLILAMLGSIFQSLFSMGKAVVYDPFKAPEPDKPQPDDANDNTDDNALVVENEKELEDQFDFDPAEAIDLTNQSKDKVDEKVDALKDTQAHVVSYQDTKNGPVIKKLLSKQEIQVLAKRPDCTLIKIQPVNRPKPAPVQPVGQVAAPLFGSGKAQAPTAAVGAPLSATDTQVARLNGLLDSKSLEPMYENLQTMSNAGSLGRLSTIGPNPPQLLLVAQKTKNRKVLQNDQHLNPGDPGVKHSLQRRSTA